MRQFRIKLPALTILTCLSMVSGKADDKAILWYQDLGKAGAAAREANKPMMLDFWAAWCAPCEVMEKEVYSNKEVIDASAKFVFVKFDFDKQEKLSRKYRVESLPFLIFTDSYGRELFRFGGLINAKAFIELIHSLPGDVTDINRLSRILARNKNSFEALSGMGDRLRAAGLYIQSNEYYGEALKKDPAGNRSHAREGIMMAMGLNYLELRESKVAIKMFERCLKEFLVSQNKALFLLGLGQAYGIAGEKEKARTILNALIAEYPTSPESLKAKEFLLSL